MKQCTVGSNWCGFLDFYGLPEIIFLIILVVCQVDGQSGQVSSLNEEAKLSL